MQTNDSFEVFCNGLALVYHESRNVRHLTRQNLLNPEPWRLVISLPTNRDAAWTRIVPLRDEALRSGSVPSALSLFEDQFRVSTEDLAQMLANENWRHAKNYGGNAWENIVRLVVDLGTAIQNQDVAADQIASELRNARHNTGSIQEKLERLEETRLGSSL